METPAAREREYVLTDRAAEFLDTLNVTLEIVAVEHQQHACSGCRQFRLLAEAAIESPVIETEILVAPFLEFPAKQGLEKGASPGQIGNRYLNVIDKIFGLHGLVILTFTPIRFLAILGTHDLS